MVVLVSVVLLLLLLLLHLRRRYRRYGRLPPRPSLVSLWPTRYFAADGFSYGSTTRNWPGLQTSSRQHISMSGSNRPLLFMPSVGPGYHDTAVRPWNGINTHARDGCAR